MQPTLPATALFDALARCSELLAPHMAHVGGTVEHDPELSAALVALVEAAESINQDETL